MRKQIVRVVTCVVVFALASVSVLASVKSEEINFQESFQLNGTKIEKGTYKVSYDEKSGELTVASRSGKVIARAKARIEQIEKKSTHTTFSTGTENGAQALRSVSFAGERQRVVVGDGGASATAGGQSQQ